MATVFEATDLALSRKVAIKVLVTPEEVDEASVARFAEEARAVAALDHPNIVRVFSAERHGSLHFLILQLIQGTSLAEVFRRGHLMEVRLVREWFLQLADALDYSHRCNVVHRDVKPGNVLIRNTGDAVLTDFGIARVGEGAHLTRTGMLVGTPAYMSPEQGSSRKLSPASDQYSLAIVLYEALTGRNPFKVHGNEWASLARHIEWTPPDVREHRPEVPEAFATALNRMLSKDPDDRFPSVLAAARAAVKEGGWGGVAVPRGGAPEASAVSGVARTEAAKKAGSSAPSSWRRFAPATVVAILAVMGVLAWTGLGRGVSGDAPLDAAQSEARNLDAPPEDAGLTEPLAPPGAADTTGAGDDSSEGDPPAPDGDDTTREGGRGRSRAAEPRSVAAVGQLALGTRNDLDVLLALDTTAPGERWCVTVDFEVNDSEPVQLLRTSFAPDTPRVSWSVSLDSLARFGGESPTRVDARGRARLWTSPCGSDGSTPAATVDLGAACAERYLSGAWFSCR
jgi:serine/threonine-protein kinase